MNRRLFAITSRIWLGRHYLSCHIAQLQNKLRRLRYKRVFPDYCRGCDGWGGSTIYNYPHAPNDFDVCEETDVETTCHQCGKDGLSEEDAEGPCFYCGWDYDNGLPEPDEYCGCDLMREGIY